MRSCLPFTQLRKKRGAERREEEEAGEKIQKVMGIFIHTKTRRQKYSGANLLDSIKLDSVLVIVGAGRLGPALRGSWDLCMRLTMKWGNNSCWMAAELVYLDAKVLSVTFPLINEHLLSIFGYTASPACLI